MSRKIIGVTVGTNINPEKLKEKLNLDADWNEEVRQIQDNKTAIEKINESYLTDFAVTYTLTTTIDSDDHEIITEPFVPTAEKPYMWTWLHHKKVVGNIEHIGVGTPALAGVYHESASGGNANYVAQDTAPEDTSVLWIDTSDNEEQQIPDPVTDEHINALIDAKLGVIENGAY